MPTTTLATLFSVSLNRDFSLSFILNPFIIAGIIAICIVIVLVKKLIFYRGRNFEIDATELGIGSQRISFKPNIKDQEIAYKVWVELSTRKIGLPIDLNNDIISEIYDSWYSFFSVTRELIKDIPVNKLKHDSTRKIIDLSVSILNEGLRPHLTLWQARFRHWYDEQLKNTKGDFDPQSIQAKYPEFKNLKEDLINVNNRLIKYREKMKELVVGLPEEGKDKIEDQPSLSN